MVIEALRFSVPVEWQARFLEEDARHWTPVLSRQAGFAGKESVHDHANPATLLLLIRWDSREQWKAVPSAELEDADRCFTAALGQHFPVLECIDYQVLG
jgi:uncharacterized protein (TIGR03792 family)